MAALAQTVLDDFQWVIDYLQNSNGLERPTLDDKSREVISRHYAAMGYGSQRQFIEDLTLRPIWTFLSIAVRLGA
jgi:hypothetical protein